MSQQDKDNTIAELEAWAQRMEKEYTRAPIEQNFLEITRLPKKIDVKSLRSLVITSTRIQPKLSEICYKNQTGSNMEQVGIVEFRSQQEAYLAVERLRLNPFTKNWITKVMTNPRYMNPEAELMSKWLN